MRNIHAEVKNAMRHTAPPLQEVSSGVVVDGPMRREDFMEPHVVLLDNPEQLFSAMGSYIELSRVSGKVARNAAEDYHHEVQHYKGALGVGAADVIQRLAIHGTGRGIFRRYRYHLGTIPLDVTDPEARAVIIGHPEVLSEGDWKGLDEADISLAGVAEIALRKGWPMPLSLQGDHKNRMPH